MSLLSLKILIFSLSKVAVQFKSHNYPIDSSDSFFNLGNIRAFIFIFGCNNKVPYWDALIVELSGKDTCGPLCSLLKFWR